MKRISKKNKNTPKKSNKNFLMKWNGGLHMVDLPRFELLAKYYKGGSYLDVGCFNSPMPSLLKEKYPESRIVAVDHAEKVIETLKNEYPTVEYLVANALSLPFGQEFDYVVAGEIIEHLENPKELISECLRVLKPGGVLAISTPKEEGKDGRFVDRDEHIWSFDENDIKELLGDCEISVYKDSIDVFVAWKTK